MPALRTAMPVYRYDTSRTVTPRIDDYSTIRFDRNNYSVPVRYVRKEVTVKGFADEVRIFYNREILATYTRTYGTKKTSYRLKHYIDLLELKPRSVFQAKPVRATVAEELIAWGRELPGGNAEMVKLLRLCVDYGQDKILAIRDSFPDGIIPTVDMIRSCLHQDPDPRIVYIKNDIEVQSTDLHRFDEKCGVV